MRLFAKNRRRDQLAAGAGAFAMLVALSSPSVAQTGDVAAKAHTANDPLLIKLVRNKVTMQAGKESLVSAATAKPGDVLQEVARYTNTSSAALTQLEATLPVPANTELVMDSARPAGALGSTDGENLCAITDNETGTAGERSGNRTGHRRQRIQISTLAGWNAAGRKFKGIHREIQSD